MAGQQPNILICLVGPLEPKIDLKLILELVLLELDEAD